MVQGENKHADIGISLPGRRGKCCSIYKWAKKLIHCVEKSSPQFKDILLEYIRKFINCQ